MRNDAKLVQPAWLTPPAATSAPPAAPSLLAPGPAACWVKIWTWTFTVMEPRDKFLAACFSPGVNDGAFGASCCRRGLDDLSFQQNCPACLLAPKGEQPMVFRT